VVQLTSALDVPLRQRNAMLLAAGFAPVYRESNLGAPELTPVRQAIDRMLKQQEPYPAVVIDRLWNLLEANEAAVAFTLFLHEGPPPPPPPGKQPNLLRSLLDPKALRPKIANWEEVARYLVSTTYAEILADARLHRRRQVVVGLHHDRDPGHPAGRHLAGSPHRMLLPGRRAQRRAVQEPGGQELVTRQPRSSTSLRNFWPPWKRARLSRKISKIASFWPSEWLAVCGEISTFGKSHSGEALSSGSRSNTSR